MIYPEQTKYDLKFFRRFYFHGDIVEHKILKRMWLHIFKNVKVLKNFPKRAPAINYFQTT